MKYFSLCLSLALGITIGFVFGFLISGCGVETRIERLEKAQKEFRPVVDEMQGYLNRHPEKKKARAE